MAPFESAASELVNESAHPLEQLEMLDEKVPDLENLGDTDAVIECRIKQLSLHRVLRFLYDFPLQPLIRAQAQLAEAYAAGGFFKQAKEHLEKAREANKSGIMNDAQCRRLLVDLLIAEGSVHMSSENYNEALKTLGKAQEVGREVYGEMDARAARIHTMLGDILQHRKQYSEAYDHFSDAWDVYQHISGYTGFDVIRMELRVAEVTYLDGHAEEAIEKMKQSIKRLKEARALPDIFIKSSAKIARWLEDNNQDREALEYLKEAEQIVTDNHGPEESTTVDIKRDVALMHLKLGEYDTALEYLNEVHYLERRLHGSKSINVGRTLKALGTVHLVKENVGEAEQCLLQALRIFESEHSANAAITRDIHTKLDSIANMSR